MHTGRAVQLISFYLRPWTYQSLLVDLVCLIQRITLHKSKTCFNTLFFKRIKQMKFIVLIRELYWCWWADLSSKGEKRIVVCCAEGFLVSVPFMYQTDTAVVSIFSSGQFLARQWISTLSKMSSYCFKCIGQLISCIYSYFLCKRVLFRPNISFFPVTYEVLHLLNGFYG